MVVMNQETIDVYLINNMSQGPHIQVKIKEMAQAADSLSIWYDKYDVKYSMEMTGY